MSVRALSWAFEQPISGNEKCVLLALADETRDDGLWPHATVAGQERIAAKAFVSTKTVSRVMQSLEAKGYLIRERRQRENGSRTSDVTMLQMGLTDKVSDDSLGGSKETPVSGPEPEGNQESLLPAATERGAQARPKPVTYRGQRVPKEMADTAVRLLSEFNVVVRRNIGAYKTDGTASTGLKQIVGAMMERPGVTEGQWVVAIRNVMMNPPEWVDGQLQLGHVFGGKAAEHALANTGERSNGSSPQKQAAADDVRRRMDNARREMS